MTGQDVINRANAIIGDAGFVRNPIADMVGYLNDGVRDLLSRRPAMLLNDDGTRQAAFEDVTTTNYTTDILPVDESVREGLAHYIAFRVFEIDQNDEHNIVQRQHHYKQYIATT